MCFELAQGGNSMTPSTPDEAVQQQMSGWHPLDPLTKEEITLTTQILRVSGRLTSRMRLMAYSLREPAKATVLAFQPGQTVTREVCVLIRDHEQRLTIEALVSLSGREILEWR